MSSVHFGAGAGVSSSGTGVPGSGTDLTFGGWFKFGSFTDFTQAFSWAGTHFLGFDIGETAAGELDLYIYDGDLSASAIATTSYADWVFAAFTHTAAAVTYPYYWRIQGQTTLSTGTLSPGGERSFTTFQIGANAFGDPVDVYARSFWMKGSVLSQADILTASSSLSAPAGTNLTFLALNDHTTAGANTGTGANWSIGGSPTTDASEPDPSIGGGGGGGTPYVPVRTRGNRRSLLGVGSAPLIQRAYSMPSSAALEQMRRAA